MGQKGWGPPPGTGAHVNSVHAYTGYLAERLKHLRPTRRPHTPCSAHKWIYTVQTHQLVYPQKQRISWAPPPPPHTHSSNALAGSLTTSPLRHFILISRILLSHTPLQLMSTPLHRLRPTATSHAHSLWVNGRSKPLCTRRKLKRSECPRSSLP